MTEDEAKTKVCPHIQYCITHPAALAEGQNPEYSQSTCLASECMAWRVTKHRWYTEIGVQKARVYVYENAPTNAVADHLGYCGLTGSPQ